MSLEAEYNAVIRSHKTTISEQPKCDFDRIPEGINFKLLSYSDGHPFIKASCSYCKTILTIENLNYVWRHCGEESPVPEEISKRLEEQQIRLGIRKKPTLIQRIKGETPSLVRAF
jgi:hypothetical protein